AECGTGFSLAIELMLMMLPPLAGKCFKASWIVKMGPRTLVSNSRWNSFSVIDIIRNKLQWVGAGIPTTEDESAEVAGPDGPDSQGISHAAARVLRTLRTSPRRHHAARHGAPAGCRWRAQRAVADRGAEIVVHFGLPEGLSPAGAAGRG